MKIGRNELCPCGSGKKYKKCCINKEEKEIISQLDRKKDLDESELISDFFSNFQNLLLRNKPHIKEYKKVRKLHSEIMESMIKYYYSGKFKLEAIQECIMQKTTNKNIKNIDNYFDIDTELGSQAMANIIIYKNSKNMNCITEDFINKNKFRKTEKIEFLNSMLNSEAGLFEIVKTDRGLGQVQLKNVFTNKEYCVTDIALSSNLFNEKFYIYTRIIRYKDVNFGSGLNIIFDKKDVFIGKWIEENLSEYDKKEEIIRFMELYNEYKRDNKGLRTKLNFFD